MNIITTLLNVTAAIGFLALTLAGPPGPPLGKLPMDVSIIRLIAAPRDFDSASVLTMGYLRMEFEGDALYLSENDFRNSLDANAIGIVASVEMRKELQKVNGMYVAIVGVYHAGPNARIVQGFRGSLTDIQRVVAISDPASPSRK